ncbi:unnamed protein product [Somion occarium]|uniref:Uncharacterized protein n=1 Tax=Somion occarium TaxID=3059160 RepID=A0ABP1CT60_9APHY
MGCVEECWGKYLWAYVDPAATDGRALSIADNWRSLKSVGLNDSFDVVLPVPGAPTDAYFFKGDKYVRVTAIVPGQGGDTVVDGIARIDVPIWFVYLYVSGMQGVFGPRVGQGENER